MTLRRGNLDDMSMHLYSLKQTDNIRSNPQLLIIEFIPIKLQRYTGPSESCMTAEEWRPDISWRRKPRKLKSG